MKNFLAVICGIIVQAIACVLIYIVFSFLGQVPIIASLLSWPVDYEVYAWIGTYSFSILAGAFICNLIGKTNSKGKKPSVIAYGIISLLYHAFCMISNCFLMPVEGVSLLAYIFAIGCCVLVTSAGFSGEDI